MGTYEELIELKNRFKATDNTIRKLIEVMIQGDSRYVDPWSTIIAAGFLDNNAVVVKEEKHTIPVIKKKELESISGPQKQFKAYAAKIAVKKGYKVTGYEKSTHGGIVDVIAVKDRFSLLIECCSCRMNKIIDYLSEEGTILWVMIRKIDDKIRVHEFRRDSNWESFYAFYNKYMVDTTQALYDEKLSERFKEKPKSKEDSKLSEFT